MFTRPAFIVSSQFWWLPDRDLEEPVSSTESPVKSANVSFHSLISTPKIQRRTAPRKRSLTYKAQLITKALFTDKKRCKQQAPTATESKKQKVRPSYRKPEQDCNESWYCKICEEDEKLDMRQCIACDDWVHEECVGLSHGSDEDEFQFVCPDCSNV